jgi:hypothetical protein
MTAVSLKRLGRFRDEKATIIRMPSKRKRTAKE